MSRRLLAPAIALMLGASLLAGCGSDDTTGSAPTAAPVTDGAADATRSAETGYTAVGDVQAGAVLLDVRTREEWDEGHATPATLLPLDKIEAGTMPSAPKDAQILVYCRSGNRAGIAADLLRKAGYSNVTNIGGFEQWKAAGGAVTN